MKCISLQQPYAKLVISALKQYETRGWITPYRGVLAIHASKQIKPEYQIAAMSEPIKSLLQKDCFEYWAATADDRTAAAVPSRRY